MPRISDVQRAARREQLINAAWARLKLHPYSQLTVDEVCEAAGSSKGGFYGYFASKQQLLHALMEREAASLDAVLNELNTARYGAAERLRRFTRASIRDSGDPARMQIRADLASAAATDPTIEAALRDSARARRTTLRAWIEEGIQASELREVPANALASILLALSDGLATHHQRDPTAFQWRNIALALDALIAGIEAEPHGAQKD